MGKQFLSLHQLYVYVALAWADDITECRRSLSVQGKCFFLNTVGLWIKMN